MVFQSALCAVAVYMVSRLRTFWLQAQAIEFSFAWLNERLLWLVVAAVHAQVLREGFMDALQGLCTVTEQSAVYQVGAAVANFSTKQVHLVVIFAFLHW